MTDLEKTRAENAKHAERCATHLAKIRRTCHGCDWQHYCENIRRAATRKRNAEESAQHPYWH